MMEFSDVISLLALIATVALTIMGQTWAMIKWFNSKMDQSRADHGAEIQLLRTKLDSKSQYHMSEIYEVNRRIDNVKDNYVRRADLDRDLQSLATGLEQLQTSLSQSLDATNTRLEAYTSSSNARLDKILLAVSANRHAD